jgi:hypothetical protein
MRLQQRGQAVQFGSHPPGLGRIRRGAEPGEQVRQAAQDIGDLLVVPA